MNNTAILVIEYVQSRTRAWNFLIHALNKVQIDCLADSGRVQVLFVQCDHHAMDSVLQVVRDDLRGDLRQAYWFGCPNPESRTHINGNSVGGLISPYSNSEMLQRRESNQTEP